MLKILPFFALMSLFPSLSQASEIALLSNSSGETLSTNLTALLFVTMLGLAPIAFTTMTPFLRFIIVFSVLRQATGLATVPTNKVLTAIAIAVSLFIMTPVLDSVQTKALQPFQAGEIEFLEVTAILKTELEGFMLNQTREVYIQKVLELSGSERVNKEDLPFSVIWLSFMLSEIQTALTIGFLIYLPFLAIDLVVSTVLMSLGMMMVSPMIIALPIKILLFVKVDGWMKIIESTAKSFYMAV